MSREHQEKKDGSLHQSELFDIPPFRIQSAEFATVQVLPDPPFVRSCSILDLDSEIVDDVGPVFIVATQQCFSEKVLLEGPVTRRNIIRHVRKAYREIYREASTLGVRGELDSLRTLVTYSIGIKSDETGLILLPYVVSDNLD